MLIHGGELSENVCFTLQRVCAHVYSRLDGRALSNWDCGLISPLDGLPRLYTSCNQGDRRCGVSSGVSMTGQMWEVYVVDCEVCCWGAVGMEPTKKN